MMIAGQVENEGDFNNLRPYVESVRLPVTLVYRVTLRDGTPIRSPEE